MKKTLKIFGIGLFIFIVLFFLIGAFLPKKYHVERSIVIAQPDNVVYQYLTNFNNFNNWSPWHDVEPNIKYKIEGKEDTIGSRYSWEGNKTGEGYMQITQLTPFKLIEQKLVFKKPMEDQAMASFVLSQENNKTKLTWNMDGENKTTLSRWFCTIMNMDKMIGKDYEKGLHRLKQQLEK